MRRSILCAMYALLILGTGFSQNQNEARLLRFPAASNDQIAFTYAGDLYTVPINGGTARKITNHTGFECFARFSPDGKSIAFTGQYDGNTEIYLVKAEGGVPKRLTYTATLNRDDASDRMGPNNIVMGWKDNSTIVYRSRQREFNDMIGQLFTVSVNGGLSEQLPLSRGGFCSFSPDASKLAYNRVFREFRTWKRYRGGQADDIWIYDIKTKQTQNITNNPAQDIFPMWHNNTVFFLSDRSGRLNLYGCDLTSQSTKQLTDFRDFDCKFPSLNADYIVFENGGYIYKYDIKNGKNEKVSISVNDDLNTSRPSLVDVSKSIASYEISPDGKRALLAARGDIFTVPQKNGPTRNLTQSSGIHERAPKWSPDARWIAYISDKSGEDEIYISEPDGSGKTIQITSGSHCYKYTLYWSPDSKKILWSDRDQKLYYVNIDSKKINLVDKSSEWEISGYTWSEDSKWIAYEKQMPSNVSCIFVYSLETGKPQQVTDEWFSSSDAQFSDDNKYLFFVSNRNFSPTYSWTEWNHSYSDMSKIYFIPLNSSVKSPFEPKSDESVVKDTSKKDEGKDKNPSAVLMDFENIYNRVVELPVQASAYSSIKVIGSKVYYQRRGAGDAAAKLLMYDLDSRKETELGDVEGYEISADKKKMLINQSGSYAIIDLPSSKIDAKDKLALTDLSVIIDRKAEWKQIFYESWRQMRDFFYAPNMHGLNWEKVRSNYEQLLPYINHRMDLTYVIGEMISELNAGHAYVSGGDYAKAERIKTGLLGAQVEKDAKSGYFKITRILNGANWERSLRSPLTEPGVNVKTGDYILSVNGKPADEMIDIFESLVNTAGKQITLKVNSKPEIKGSRDVVVIPIAGEQDLYYYDWVQKNIRKVSEATDGQVGYIHIPDMGAAGLNQFVKLYYPQLKKRGLIIDVRGNGGGNVSPMILERLRRQITMMTIARNTSFDTDPTGMHVGPKVALINEFSMSDGDIFSYRFKKHNIGKTIGKRTWGGVVGIRGSLPFIDGGSLSKPEFSRYDVEGRNWIMEGVGVEPDIEVENDPALEYTGTDQQLDKAIDVIKEEIKNFPSLNPPPPYPDKSK